MTSFMDGVSSFGFKAKVRGIVCPLASMPVEAKGRVFIGNKNDKDQRYETSILKIGDEFYFRFKSASDGFLAVYLVDEDELVCKAAPISKDTPPLKRIYA